jgi:hypothetical protein
MDSRGIAAPVSAARTSETALLWLAAVVIPLFLIAPAVWNGYPLLQWDTGGYLARWYEGYLVPSRSTVFGVYLHLGEAFDFWINLVVQALLTLWILRLTLRVLGMGQPARLLGVGLLLILGTALPWLASMLLTDIFAGLSVLSLFILVLHGSRISTFEKCGLIALTAFASATHSATLAVLVGLCCVGFAARLVLDRISLAGLMQGCFALAAGALLLLSTNYMLSGKFVWTPGGYGIPFGRMLQDGIVARYLNDHCPHQNFKLCPYRNELPATADDFLWGHSMFDKLGRFAGLDDEMGYIVVHSLAEYPAWQAETAIVATARQLAHVATGEGTNGWIPHTYGIIARYIPSQLKPMRAAHQQHWMINFTAVNRLHVPVAFASMILVMIMLGHAVWRRRSDDLTLLAATVAFAILGNAVVCGVISGPHDRYGARMVWLASLVVLATAARWFGKDETPPSGGERHLAASLLPAPDIDARQPALSEM